MNFKENKPIYLQIADRIMDEILCNVYREEERIPSVREYAATVEVNANTMVRSYDYLQRKDYRPPKRIVPEREPAGNVPADAITGHSGIGNLGTLPTIPKGK